MTTSHLPDAPRRPQIAVSTAVFREGLVLLASRMAAPSQGLFSLPGGRVEYGETLEEAALRELDEEVGVSASILGFVDHVEIRDVAEDGALRFHGFVCVFAALWRAGEPQVGPEAGEIVWADQAKIASLPTTVRLAEVVAKAEAIVKASGNSVGETAGKAGGKAGGTAGGTASSGTRM